MVEPSSDISKRAPARLITLIFLAGFVDVLPGIGDRCDLLLGKGVRCADEGIRGVGRTKERGNVGLGGLGERGAENRAWIGAADVVEVDVLALLIPSADHIRFALPMSRKGNDV